MIVAALVAVALAVPVQYGTSTPVAILSSRSEMNPNGSYSYASVKLIRNSVST